MSLAILNLCLSRPSTLGDTVTGTSDLSGNDWDNLAHRYVAERCPYLSILSKVLRAVQPILSLYSLFLVLENPLAGQTPNSQSSPGAAHADFAAIAARHYAEAQKRYLAGPTNSEAAWQFARACYDWADWATNRSQRAELAREGIAVSEKAVAVSPDSAATVYYLGMNQAQLAQTKGLGALKLVRQMEQVFLRVHDLDEHFDYAGADRNLGLLYRDAPSLGSIGSRAKARQHLQRAVELAPDYPENRLNLLEAYLKWNDTDAARRELKGLEDGWSSARSRFRGDDWSSSWLDWQKRRERAQDRLQPFR